jgi:hypothetical protein
MKNADVFMNLVKALAHQIGNFAKVKLLLEFCKFPLSPLGRRDRGHGGVSGSARLRPRLW